jgi:hypothetical protein
MAARPLRPLALLQVRLRSCSLDMQQHCKASGLSRDRRYLAHARGFMYIPETASVPACSFRYSALSHWFGRGAPRRRDTHESVGLALPRRQHASASSCSETTGNSPVLVDSPARSGVEDLLTRHLSGKDQHCRESKDQV